MEKDYKILVAYDNKRGIGYNLDIPWHISEDLKRFKKLTLGQSVIMGSRTYQSIINKLGKPLPGRTNIILSKNLKKTDFENCFIFNNVEEILAKVSQAWIIGGNDIYRAFLPFVNEIYATEIEGEYTCDVFFPEIKENEWEVRDTEEKSGYRYITYSRK